MTIGSSLTCYYKGERLIARLCPPHTKTDSAYEIFKIDGPVCHSRVKRESIFRASPPWTPRAWG